MAKLNKARKLERRASSSAKGPAKKIGRALRLDYKISKKTAKSKHWHVLSMKAKARQAYDFVATTSDGVLIIRAKVRPRHFTAKEIRKAISDVEAEAASA